MPLPKYFNKKRDKNFIITKNIDSFFIEIYRVCGFVKRFFKELFIPPYEFQEVMRQCYIVGYRSLGLISLTGFITGIVFTKQSRPSLS
jgi:phospholipid/cholesterol/gamma-HCH transport system permease protein